MDQKALYTAIYTHNELPPDSSDQIRIWNDGKRWRFSTNCVLTPKSLQEVETLIATLP